jgi:lipid II:glycine glycyltransferase (peptidoglycan interpeptide bridge formation enzyme)
MLVLWLDLKRDEDAVFRGMSSSSRAQVRRGYKTGVEFTLGDAADLDEFYRLMTVTGQHKGIAVHDAEYYRRLFAHLNQSAQVQLFLGRLSTELVTTGVSVRYGRKAWLLYAASSPQHHNLRVNRTLQWEMIKWAHAAGCERYDFRGTACSDPPSPSDPGFGVYEFKNSFGPEYVRLVGYFDFVARPMTYKLMRLAEERLLPAAYRLRTWLPHGESSAKE